MIFILDVVIVVIISVIIFMLDIEMGVSAPPASKSPPSAFSVEARILELKKAPSFRRVEDFERAQTKKRQHREQIQQGSPKHERFSA